MKKQILTYILLCCFYATSLFGQSNQCVLHLDKAFYVSGEIIWYQLFLPNDFESKELMIKALLADKNGTVEDYNFLKTAGKRAINGYYKIPFDQITGIYHLVFGGTNPKTGGFVKMLDVPISIYNDLENIVIKREDLLSVSDAERLNMNDLKIEIELQNEKVATRNEVKGKILLKNQDGASVSGAISLAVTDLNLIGNVTAQSNIIIKELPTGIADNLAAEIYVKGNLFDENDAPIFANLLGNYSPEEQRMSFTSTEKNGRFLAKLQEFYGDKSIQFLGYEKETEAIKVTLETKIPINETPEIQYTAAVLEYLNRSRQRKKIFQLFTALEANLQAKNMPFEIQELVPDKTFIIKDYESFKDMSTFFKEIQTVLKFRSKKEGIIAEMFNPKTQWNYKGKPIFIIDGKVTRDAGYIANFPMDQVEKVDLFFDLKNMRRQFSAMGTSGVVMITTNLPQVNIPENDAADIFTINGLLPPADFPAFQPEKMNEGQPFFRPQLFWNPNLEANENGEIEFSFYQTDDVGKFQIEVIGQDKEGKVGRGSLLYKVGVEE